MPSATVSFPPHIRSPAGEFYIYLIFTVSIYLHKESYGDYSNFYLSSEEELN